MAEGLHGTSGTGTIVALLASLDYEKVGPVATRAFCRDARLLRSRNSPTVAYLDSLSHWFFVVLVQVNPAQFISFGKNCSLGNRYSVVRFSLG